MVRTWANNTFGTWQSGSLSIYRVEYGRPPSLYSAAMGPASEVGRPRSLLVVSHPCVVPANQAVYARLRERGWSVTLVVPERWRHEYAAGSFQATAWPGMEDVLRPLRVALAGRPQRHFYLARPRPVITAACPCAAFLEQEPFSLSGVQWGAALHRLGIPFGLQADENLDRSLPVPIKFARRWLLEHAAFVTARSPAAGELVRRWGAKGEVEVVPHAVPDWHCPEHVENGPFTIGFAGRLVPEKGLQDLIAAAERVGGPLRVLLAGNGPMRTALESASRPEMQVEVRADFSHETMPAAYAQMDVLVLPSRTTPTWKEQFGRVLVEALSCGVPVVGSDCGEIPWVIDATNGGRVFPEGDVDALTRVLSDLRDDPALRGRLGEQGRDAVRRRFSLDACADGLESLIRTATRSRQPGSS
jgi:glycosyltransferase involved in cell wall biosynthesis